MRVGDDDVVTFTQDITITDSIHSPTVGSGEISLGQSKLLGEAFAGGTAAFKIDVTVPEGKSFELKTSGSVSNDVIKPAGLVILSKGFCTGFLQEAIIDNTLESNFGVITNADPDYPSKIELMVVFDLTEAAAGSLSEALTIGGASVAMTGTISPAPAQVGDLVGTGTVLGLSEHKNGIMPGMDVL